MGLFSLSNCVPDGGDGPQYVIVQDSTMLTRMEIVDPWAYPVCNNPRQKFEICIQEGKWPVIFWLGRTRYFFRHTIMPHFCESISFSSMNIWLIISNVSYWDVFHVGWKKSWLIPSQPGALCFFPASLLCVARPLWWQRQGYHLLLGVCAFSISATFCLHWVYLYRVIFIFHEHCEGT